MAVELKDLLFYETFSHDSSEELWVDMVKFSMPVLIKEVRVVPKGCPPHVSLHIMDKLGKTTPSSFKLDVFTNDATNPLTPTCNLVGMLDFNEDCLSLPLQSKTSCDVIIVRGHYSTLSLCLYGITVAPVSFNLPGFTPGTSRSPSPYSEKLGEDGVRRKRARSPSDAGGPLDSGRDGSPGQGEEKDGTSKEWSSLLDSFNTLFEPFSPDHSPEHSFDLYDDDIPPTKRSATNDPGFEEFSDDEIAFAEEDFEMQEPDFDTYSEDTWMNTNVGFSPYHTELTALETFPSLFNSPHEELLLKKTKTDSSTSKKSHYNEGTRFNDQLLKLKQESISFKWLESVEELSQQLYPCVAQLFMKSEDDAQAALQCLCDWVSTCLDNDIIQSHPPPLNVRVMKTGLRLGFAVISLGSDATNRLLELGLLERLCNFVSQPSSLIPSSIKLAAVRVINALLDYPISMERFLGWNTKDKKGQTPYREMLEVVLSNQTTRVQSAVSCLLCKGHLYELLSNLQDCVNEVIIATPVKNITGLTEDFWNLKEEVTMETNLKDEEQTEGGSRGQDGEKFNEDTSSGSPMRVQPLSPELVKKLTQLLVELRNVLDKVDTTLCLLPPKAFPSKKIVVDQPVQEVFVGVARMLKTKRFLECLLILLTAPSLLEENNIFSGVRDLFLLLLCTQNGLLFLLSRPPIIKAIIRVLFQTTDNEVPLDAVPPLSDFLQPDANDTCTAFNIGMLLVYHLQVLQSLDSLRQAPKQTMSDMESECLSSLHTLFSMTLVPVGKCAVAHVLSLDNNITVLLPFMEPKGHKEHDSKLSKSCISSRYAAVLILQVLQSSCNLSHDFLTTHSRRLLAMSEFFKDNQSPTMSALYCWLHPLKHLGESAATISLLMGVIKESISQLSWNKPTRGVAAIITSLRLILTYCCPNPHLITYKKKQLTLVEQERLVALFSSGAIEIVTNLLQKLADMLLPLWSQKQIIGLNNAGVLVLLSSLSLRLLRLLLVELLDDGTFQCRDVRVLHALFSVHTVMCSAPHSGVFQSSVPEIQPLIVDCLVTFTRPDTINEDNKESSPNVSNSCWCLLIAELISYTSSKPQGFLSGLMLFSDLLPLPLPLHSPKPLSPTDLENIVSLRYLWAAHLLPLLPELLSLLEMLVPSMCLALQQMLRRVCAQLVDLAPTLALGIAKIICSRVLMKIDSQDEGVKEIDNTSATTEKKETLSPLVMILTLCAVLSRQSMFKAALLSLISKEDNEESYSRFIPLLLFLVQKKETVISAKLCVMTILQALVNVFVTLSEPAKNDSQVSLQHLADSLPPLPQLEHILSAVLKHIGSPDQPLTTIALGLKTISACSQHMPGLTTLQTLLPSSIKQLAALLKRLVSAIRDSTSPPAESLQCSSIFLDTLGDLIAPDSSLPLSIPLPLLKCAICDDEMGDLLPQLLIAIKEGYKEEEDQRLADDFTASIAELTDLLADYTPDASGLTPPSLDLPAMQSLEQQFLSRPSVLQTGLELSSSPEYWLATPPYDEAELEPETLSINIEDLAKESCSGLNLQEELKKQFLPSPPSSPAKHERKKKIVISGPEAQQKLKEAIQQRRALGRGRDLFRTRKQNTSRPPSMHVDEFMNIGPRLPGGLQREAIGSMSRGLIRGRGGMGGLSSGYMMPPPPLLPPHLSGRWMSGISASLGPYHRRDLPGLHPPSMHSWESRTQQFLASISKPEPMRSVWSHVMQQDPYNRARSARMVEMTHYARPSPSSSRMSSRLSRRN